MLSSLGNLARRPLVVFGLTLVAMLVGATTGWYYMMRPGFSAGWRTSQYFFAYQDLGFVKRGLPATLMHSFPALCTQTGILLTYAAFLLGFAWLFARFFSRALQEAAARERALLLLLCLLTPGFVMRLSFDYGRFDILGIAAVVTGVLWLEQGRRALVALACVVAVLSHEAFVVINLPLLLAYAWTREEGRPQRERILSILSWLWAPSLAFLAIAVLGQYEPGLDALVAFFSKHQAYLAAVNGHAPDADALSVLARDPAENVGYASRMFWEKKAWLHLPVIGAWLAVFTTYYISFFRGNKQVLGLLFISAFSPLFLSVIACDYYRWVALASVNMVLVMAIVAWRSAKETQPVVVPAGLAFWFLIASSLLGPISNTKSFPYLFMFLERCSPWPFTW